MHLLAQRTRGLRLVLQDIHEAHNASACIRTADALGIHYVDIVNIREKFKISTVARGSTKWLSLQRRKNILDTALNLKAQGFKLAAAVVRDESISLNDLPTEMPIALIFGNEHDGISPQWHEHLDYSFKIPMYGMVESFNISVAVAISLFTLRQKQERDSQRFLLSELEKNKFLDQWISHQMSP